MIEIIIRDGGQDFSYEVSKETSDAIEAMCEADNAGYERYKERLMNKIIQKIEGKKFDWDVLKNAPTGCRKSFNEGLDTAIRIVEKNIK